MPRRDLIQVIADAWSWVAFKTAAKEAGLDLKVKSETTLPVGVGNICPRRPYSGVPCVVIDGELARTQEGMCAGCGFWTAGSRTHGDPNARAKVTLYGHADQYGNAEIEAQFLTGASMHRTDGEERGACFFFLPVDYDGLPVGRPNAYPRARYQHLLGFVHFNWATRRGQYFHVPYGGKIDIEAI